MGGSAKGDGNGGGVAFPVFEGQVKNLGEAEVVVEGFHGVEGVAAGE